MQVVCSGKIPEAVVEKRGEWNLEGWRANTGLYHWLVVEDTSALSTKGTTCSWMGHSTGIFIHWLLPPLVKVCPLECQLSGKFRQVVHEHQVGPPG